VIDRTIDLFAAVTAWIFELYICITVFILLLTLH